MKRVSSTRDDTVTLPPRREAAGASALAGSGGGLVGRRDIMPEGRLGRGRPWVGSQVVVPGEFGAFTAGFKQSMLMVVAFPQMSRSKVAMHYLMILKGHHSGIGGDCGENTHR